MGLIFFVFVAYWGAAGLMMLILMANGIYDPVVADGLAPDRVSALRTRLMIQVAVALGVAWLVWRSLHLRSSLSK